MPVSTAGPWDIVEGIIAQLDAHLATDLAAVIAGANPAPTFTMSVPDSTTGLSRSGTVDPMDKFNAVYVWCASEEPIDHFMNLGIERRKVTISIMWSMASMDLQELSGRLLLGARAISRCIQRRWRAMDVAIHSGRQEKVSYHAGSLRKTETSNREAGQGSSNIDHVIVTWSFVQQTGTPVEFT